MTDLNRDNIETFAEVTKAKAEVNEVELFDTEDKSLEEDLEMNEDFDNIFDESVLFDDFEEDENN